MIAATSVLQQQAADIRLNKVNWQSYVQSLMISQEDFGCVVALDSDKRGAYLHQDPSQCAKTFLNLLSHVSKDQTIQYILVMIDDLLQEDRSRVEIFHEYAAKRKESVWGPFLNLFNRQDGFIVNMSSRILAKLACWGQEQMPKADLHFYLQWLKDQLIIKVCFFVCVECGGGTIASSECARTQHRQYFQISVIKFCTRTKWRWRRRRRQRRWPR